MLNIILAGKNEKFELKAKDQLERLLSRYDLSKYFFCRDITMSWRTMPASHPSIILNTRYVEDNDDDSALASFIHEQLHWYLDEKVEETKKAIEELKSIYKNVPIGYPDGAKSEHSTYLHLIVNTLEYQGLKELIGEERARKVIEKKNYYLWIYAKVLKENSKLLELIQKNNLSI